MSFHLFTKETRFPHCEAATDCLDAWKSLFQNAKGTLNVQRNGEITTIKVSYLQYDFNAHRTCRGSTEVALKNIALIKHTFEREDETSCGIWECTNTYTLTFQGTDPTTEGSKSVTIRVQQEHSGSTQNTTWYVNVKTATTETAPVPKRPRSPEGK